MITDDQTTLTIERIQQAAQRLQGQHVVTPVLESPRLNDLLGKRLLFKAEMLQRTGSFKFRGAYYFLSVLDEAVRRRGVVAYSSGNHAQAVAVAARLFQVPATIVMPADAPAVKIEGTRAHGAEVVLYDRYTQSREDIAGKIVSERGGTLIPPFDHLNTMTGQGTVGLEFVQQAQAMETPPDTVLIPCSGGGLAAGCTVAIKSLSPQTRIIVVEPEGFGDMGLSLLRGERQRIAFGNNSLCDSLLVPEPGTRTFPILKQADCLGLTVSDEAVLQAMRLIFEHLKLVTEPGGAVGLAAVLSGQAETLGDTLGIVLSGGNVSPKVFRKALAADMEKPRNGKVAGAFQA